ncbi:MAG: hypothetical protein IKX56_07810 [Muribaculaceae bacterium]|nr:hypothetical protein [Muribaculaceae bacterium]
MKKIIGLIALLSIITLATSCKGGDSDPKAELLKAVNDLNRACPIITDLFTCESAALADQNLVIRYTIDDNTLTLAKASPEVAKKVFGAAFFEASPEVADLLNRSGFDLKLIFTGAESGEEATLSFNEQDIKDVKMNPPTDEELIDWQLKSTNATMPQAVDIATTLVSLERDGDQLTYVYEVDDTKMDFAEFIDGQKQFRLGIIANLEASNTPQSSFGHYLKLLCRSGKSLCYSYRAKSSGKAVNINFTNSDLRTIAHYNPKD